MIQKRFLRQNYTLFPTKPILQTLFFSLYPKNHPPIPEIFLSLPPKPTQKMEKTTRIPTESEAYTRLTALCARSELCRTDALRRLSRWQVADTIAEQIVARLMQERYIDEQRYANAFARDKFRYNHWGTVKIAQELKRRHIPSSCIDTALADIDTDESQATLHQLLQKKRPSVKGKNAYEIRGKLIRYAVGKGFPLDEVMKEVEHLEDWDDE